MIENTKKKIMKKMNLFFILLFIITNCFSQIDNDNSAMLDLVTYVADSYQKKNDFVTAEKYYIEVKNSALKLFGNNSIEYAISLNNLGLNYYYKNDYKNAEINLNEATTIRRKTLGMYNSDYASSKLNLGVVFLAIENYQLAENNFEEAGRIFKINDMQEMYAISINNLGLIYFLREDYSKAEKSILEALEIKKKLLGENDLDYAKSLMSCGMFYINREDFQEAEIYISRSISIYKNKYGEQSSLYASNTYWLAVLYIKLGRYNEARQLCEKSNEILIKDHGENDLITTLPISILNFLYEYEHKMPEADSLLIKLIRIYKNQMINNFAFMSMNQSLAFIKSQERSFSYAYSYLSRNSNSNAVSNLFDMDLFIRNISLYNLNKLEQIAKRNGDTSIVDKRMKYKYYKEILSESTTQNNEIEKKAEILEKEIMSALPEYKDAIKNNSINWKDIQNKIKTNEAVVSFVSFRYYSKFKLSDSILYAAFVLRKEWDKPRFISICNESQLSQILDTINNSSSINILYAENSNYLYNTIWKPIDTLFIGVKKVYLSPTALLNKISFSAIPLPSGDFLYNKYEIEIMSNVRTIATNNKSQTEIKSVYLFGDIDYDSEPVSNNHYKSYQVSDTTSISTIRSLAIGKWGNLNSTGVEVSAIEAITKELKIATISFIKKDASEENFKNVISPTVLHIATHGFASPQPKQILKEDNIFTESQKNIFQKSIDPLTRSGLIMSGGNQMWQKGMPFLNHEDEILTAKEVSEMDLSGCVLATLSACETGLGDIKGSEGVFGLQRAFKIAGVQYTIVSLWKIPDAATSDFMQTFYKKWLRDKNEINVAFRMTQLEMSNKYNQPYKWAGFVLIE